VRSVLVICATILLIGGGFFAYLWFQPAVAERPINKIAARQAASRPTSTTKISGLGSTDSAWILRIDPKTGELASQFRGERYDPQPGNIVLVDHPEAEFFSNDGKQRIHIGGQKGRVHVAGVAANQKPGTFAGKMEAPSRGLLEDVVVTIFEPSEATVPSVTIRMNNASFDNDAFRLETQAFVDPATGKQVDADQVPVELRGTDYDFDGRGLVLLWNERDRKLQLLEIAHGERLTIKNLKLLNKPEVANTQSRRLNPPLAEMLASIDPGAVVLVQNTVKKPTLAQRQRAATHPHPATQTQPATRPRITRDLSPTVYRATFYDAVKIFEAETQVATADVMNVDFLQGQSKSATQPSTGPATQSTTRASRRSSASRPGQQANVQNGPASAPASAPSTQQAGATTQTATTQNAPKAQGPITIKWTGKLRVVPREGAAAPALTPNKALVQLVGNPVTLDRDESRITCGEASYNSADQSADLRGSESMPLVKMTDAHGAVVTTPHMVYTEISPTDKIANLIGPSTAEIPDNSEPGKSQTIKTRWQDKCTLNFITDAQGRTYISKANLNGAVVVNHPKLDLTSDAMALAFAPAPAKHPTTVATTAVATTEPVKTLDAQLKQVVATGNVVAEMRDVENSKSTISTRQLTVMTDVDPHGGTFARTIEAIDDVHTHGSSGDLTAGYLVAKLKPSTRKSTTQVSATEPATTYPATRPKDDSMFASGADLESLVAKDKVHFATTQGAANADTLEINSTDGPQRIHLLGEPASVTTGSSIVTGKRIDFTPSLNLAEIPGAGKLHATSQPSSRPTTMSVAAATTGPAAARPTTMPGAEAVDIEWEGNARIDGNTDMIHINDNVRMLSKQADGTMNTATSKQLVATLVNRAATQPTTQMVASSQSATTKKSKDKSGPLMQDKDIATATLIGDVEVKSELLAPGGELLRGFNLFTQTLTYDKVHGKMTVPVPGQMLYQDHRASADSKVEGPTVGSGRGASAFEWKDSLVYDEPAHLATLKGDVRIVHRPENNKDQPFKLDAQTVIADFGESSASARPADNSKMHLNLVTATDQVHVSSTRATVDAFELTFNPTTNTVVAGGTDANPGTLYDNVTGSTTSFTKVEWNTETDQFSVTKASGRMRK
jgi:hypothetical protein